MQTAIAAAKEAGTSAGGGEQVRSPDSDADDQVSCKGCIHDCNCVHIFSSCAHINEISVVKYQEYIVHT